MLLQPAPRWPCKAETGTSTGEFRDEADSAAGDWPRTTRVLPWMLAGFLAILWLVPFNEVELNASLPIDLKLDRLVLPFIVVVWVVAVVAGGRVAPRLRFTWIHVALAAFVASAFLSVVLDARYLNQTLELDLSLKKLPLLVSYVSLFVIVASAVRRTEVRAFLTYTLALAVVCAAGVIWEYRFKTNPFNDLTDRLVPVSSASAWLSPRRSITSAAALSGGRPKLGSRRSRCCPSRSRSPLSRSCVPNGGGSAFSSGSRPAL